MNNQIFKSFEEALTGLFNQMFTPLIAIATALSVLWGIWLGLKWWRSGGDENKRKEAKSAVLSFVLGTIIIFAVAVGAPLLIGALSEWMSAYTIAKVTFYVPTFAIMAA